MIWEKCCPFFIKKAWGKENVCIITRSKITWSGGDGPIPPSYRYDECKMGNCLFIIMYNRITESVIPK